ncbi:MAG: hypothetical protein AAGC67_22810 [Myxococcota bacterium]
MSRAVRPSPPAPATARSLRRRERQRPTPLIAICLLLGLASPVHAETADLFLVADGDGRWFETFSEGFGQVDGGPLYGGGPDFPDCCYDSSALPAFAPIGDGTVRVFPFGADFGDVGDIEFDESGLTGVGTEVAPITAVTIDFQQFIADDDTVTGQGYESVFQDLTGSTVTLVDGVIVDIDLSATVIFSYDFNAFGQVLPFPGTFDVDATSFDLHVDPPPYITQFGTVGYRWLVTGAAQTVPEPAFALPIGGLALAWTAGRRRIKPMASRTIR